MSAPAATSVGWCMPRYRREVATMSGEQDGQRPDDDGHPALREARGDEQREPAVHGDRRGHVAGRVALVHRQVVEVQDRRAVAVDDQARDAVGRELDQDRAEHERGDAPAASSAATSTTSVTSAGRTGMSPIDEPTKLRSLSVGVAVRREPGVDRLVVVPDRVDGEETSISRKPRAIVAAATSEVAEQQPSANTVTGRCAPQAFCESPARALRGAPRGPGSRRPSRAARRSCDVRALRCDAVYGHPGFTP